MPYHTNRQQVRRDAIDFGSGFSNLYTNGNEFYIFDTTDVYVGPYHIMDGVAMSEGTHSVTSVKLIAISGIRQQQISTTTKLAVKGFIVYITNGTEFLLDNKSYIGKYIKVGLSYYTFYLDYYGQPQPETELTKINLEPNFNNIYLNKNNNINVTSNYYRNITNFVPSEKKDEVISNIKEEINSIKLNVDYSDFKNFVLFGSAVEEVYNFKLKIQKLKKLRKNILELDNTNDNLLKYTLKNFREEKEDIIQNFTNYEKYLFYENNYYYDLDKLSSTNISSSLSGNFTYLGKYSESFYYVSNTSESVWENARLTSSYYSGSLTTIHNKSTNDFLSSSLIGKSINTQGPVLWIGLYQKSLINEPSGGWVWVDDNVLSDNVFSGWKGYTNWNTLEPNNTQSNEHYGQFYTHSGKWNDDNIITQTNKFSYILEVNTYHKFTEGYFATLSYSASLFDEGNLINLLHYLPSFMREDTVTYTGYKRMVNMVGEYFDNLWLYTKNISNRDIDDINSKEYIPYQLLPSFLNQYNLYVKSKFEDTDILKFLYNLNKEGKTLGGYNQSDRVYTEKLYRRLLHSAPYILKSKGTKKSILSILNSYGISEEYLDITETNVNKKLDPYYYNSNKVTIGGTFSSKVYYLQFKGDQKVKLNWVNVNSKKPDTIEVRFKTNHNSALYTNHILFEKSSSHGSFYVTLNTTGSTYGNASGVAKLIFKSGSNVQYSSTAELPIFNDITWNLMLRRSDFSSDGTQSYAINLNQFKFKKFNFTGSTSVVTEQMTNLYNSDGYVYIGGSSSFIGGNSYGTPYYGDLNEFRMWNEYLSNDIFNKHSKSVSTYFGKYDTSSFTTLINWLKFDQDINHYSTSSVWDYNLAGIRNHGTASNFENGANDTNYVTFFEDENIGDNNEKNNTEKIVILETQKDPVNLNPDTRTSKTSKELLGETDNKLSINLSTNTIFDKDLMRSVDNFDIDNYIGDYRDYYKDSYESLDNLKKTFVNKFNLTGSFDVFNMINYVKYFDLSFFKLIEENIPYKADYQIGVKIEQTKLERNKVYAWKKQNKSEYKNLEDTIKYNELNFKTDIKNLTSSIKYDENISFKTEYKSLENTIVYKDLNFKTYYENIFTTLSLSVNYVNSKYLDQHYSLLDLKENSLEGDLIKDRQDHPFRVTVSDGIAITDKFKSKRNRFDGISYNSTQTQINPISDIKKLPLIYNTGSDDRYINATWSFNNGTYIDYHQYHISKTINRFKFNDYEGTLNYDNPVETTYKNRKTLLVVNSEEGKSVLKVK